MRSIELIIRLTPRASFDLQPVAKSARKLHRKANNDLEYDFILDYLGQWVNAILGNSGDASAPIDAILALPNDEPHWRLHADVPAHIESTPETNQRAVFCFQGSLCVLNPVTRRITVYKEDEIHYTSAMVGRISFSADRRNGSKCEIEDDFVVLQLWQAKDWLVKYLPAAVQSRA